jgi:hypothetical protein
MKLNLCHPLDEEKKFPRCWWHILIGIGLPWLPIFVPHGTIYMVVGILFFISYQILQYKFKSTHLLKDNSFLDIFETGVAYAISLIILICLTFMNIINA